MKTLSLKLDEKIFEETDKLLKEIRLSRNRYINEALHFYNQLQKRKLLARKLEVESGLVAEESRKVLNEFEQFIEDA